MEDRKKIIVASIILAVLILLVAYGIIVFRNAKNQTVSNQQSTQPAATTPTANFYIPSANDKDISIKTPVGAITINNVYKDAISQLSQGGVSFKDNNDYYIAYYPQDQGFIITMKNQDIQKARQEAEADFVQTLGITKDQACSLRVSLTIPEDVNEQASGGNYGLSFCPNGKPFPNQ